MTAVTWLLEELKKVHHPTEAMIMYAKKLEREQHGKTWDSAIEQGEKRAWNISRLYTDFDDYFAETYGSKGSDEPNGKKVLSALKDFRDSLTEEEKETMFKGSDDHIVNTNKMVKRGTLKKRMDKDAWFVVFQSNAYNESDMAYELIKSQEIDIDMYDVYKDGDEVTFEVVNKKWAKITPFLYPFKTTSSQTEISDEEIRKAAIEYANNVYDKNDFKDEWRGVLNDFIAATKWYREQLKKKQ